MVLNYSSHYMKEDMLYFKYIKKLAAVVLVEQI